MTLHLYTDFGTKVSIGELLNNKDKFTLLKFYLKQKDIVWVTF